MPCQPWDAEEELSHNTGEGSSLYTVFLHSLPISVSWPPGILPWNEHMTAVRVFRVLIPTHTGRVVQPPYVTDLRLPSPACFRKENTKSAVKYLWCAAKPGKFLLCLPCFRAAYSLATVLQSLMWDFFFLGCTINCLPWAFCGVLCGVSVPTNHGRDAKWTLWVTVVPQLFPCPA